MNGTKKNQLKPVRLTYLQATRLAWLIDDLLIQLGRGMTPDEKTIVEPVVWQVQVYHAELAAEMGHPGKAVDK